MIKGILITKILGSVIRHGATALGGVLMAEGYADEQTVQQITGGIVALGGVTLSILEKRYKF
ncbi:MAG: hypothetical protein ACRBBO_05990 [Cognatishimia sp.]